MRTRHELVAVMSGVSTMHAVSDGVRCSYACTRPEWLTEVLCSQAARSSFLLSISWLANTIFWKQMKRFWCQFFLRSHGMKWSNLVRRSKVKDTQCWNKSQKSLSVTYLKNYHTNFTPIMLTALCFTTTRMQKVKIAQGRRFGGVAEAQFSTPIGFIRFSSSSDVTLCGSCWLLFSV